jgi:hypothetical protein
VQSYYTLIALDIASERAREAERRHLYDVDRANEPETGRSPRRGLASVVAAVSRGSGRLARRLDENVNVTGALIGRSIASNDGCVESRS